MIDYPLVFSTSSNASKGDKTWKSAIGSEEYQISVPEEFGGDPGAPSPEDLFTASVENCIVATFKTIAERKNLEFEEIESETEAVLDRSGERSRPVISEVNVEMGVTGIEDGEEFEEVRKAALRNCFIHRSIRSSMEITIEEKAS